MSDSEMLKAAKAEAQRLESELNELPLYKKLQSVRQLIALYEPAPDWRPLPIHPKPKFFGGSGNADKFMPRELTKTSQIEAAAVTYLAAKKARATSGELVLAMAEAGIEIGGKEPNKALSAYLSGMASLNNVREYGGYGLAEWGQNAGPDLLTKTGA
ncbi:hypothetical protein [Tardiphaga sp. 841_E9_N1_2]|uniref:hypothetical protein n=1 Tax=Tardiphaga sp. 841_E9_N1_2 TaxID=3240762 RepID=UPI003F25E11D